MSPTGRQASSTQPAQLPPPGIIGLDPSWSRLVTAPDHAGINVRWHLLDTHHGRNTIEPPALTVLCVHGNPSWSFLWRHLAAAAPDSVRVIAVDQLDMGFSERTGRLRRLGDRVDDLANLTKVLGLSGDVVTAAHDWGGPVSLGWALRWHRGTAGRLAGVILTNTAVHQPVGSPAPSVIRLARSAPLLRSVTVHTDSFIRGAVEMSRPRVAPEVRDGYYAPYRTAARRAAIADFVADIPLEAEHPTAPVLDAIASGLSELADVPVALMWGPSDPVFSDLYLHDFEQRLPHADVHRFVGAHHFVHEEADVAAAMVDWIEARCGGSPPETPVARSARDVEPSRLCDGLRNHPNLSNIAVVERSGGTSTSITFGDLRDRVEAFAAGLESCGIDRNERVAVMVPPGIDLDVVVYGCWAAGVVVVVVDSGLGPKNMSRALKAAAADHLIGIPKAIAAASVFGWPGRRIVVGSDPSRWPGVAVDLASIEAAGRVRLARPDTETKRPESTDAAVLAFTSGSTGPSKGVEYRHGQLAQQADALRRLYGITSSDRLVAAFAPFALYGPMLGICSVVPDMDITKPGTLTAVSLAEAVTAIDATMVFASPAALANVVATAADLSDADRRALGSVRILLSAGAPVNPTLLSAAAALVPNAEAHTPYGMTEVLPVADVTLSEIERVAEQRQWERGVCVGRPIEGVEVRIDALRAPAGAGSTEPFGEIVIRAAHTMDGYDRLWWTKYRARTSDGWHRSGDVGSIDGDGYLWVGGRIEHLIWSPDGPVMPVPIELAAESVGGVLRAAAVGIGPVGRQRVAVVVEPARSRSRTGRRGPLLADQVVTAEVRAAVAEMASSQPAGIDVVAVLNVSSLPVDRRHNSKIDRPSVARYASAVLAGERPPRW